MKEALRYLNPVRDKSLNGINNAKEILKNSEIEGNFYVDKKPHLYDTLHIAGYYRGLILSTDMVKDALKAAKVFIEKIR